MFFSGDAIRASPVRRSDFLLLTWVASMNYLVVFFQETMIEIRIPGTCITTVVTHEVYGNQTPTIDRRRYYPRLCSVGFVDSG